MMKTVELTDEWSELTVIHGPEGILSMELIWKPQVQVQVQPVEQVISKRYKIKRPQLMLKSAYTAEEVKNMSDMTLQKSFIAIHGANGLHCSHCRRSTPIETNWMYAIRKRGEKHGLSSDIPIPKTCDSQLKKNERVNPVNNLAYNTMRRVNVSDTIKQDLLVWRKHMMEEMGVHTRPRLYKV